MTAVERKVVHERLQGRCRRADRERGDGAESVRRRPPRLTTPGSPRSSRHPGLTSLRDPAEARRVLLDDSLRGARARRARSTGRSSTSGAAAARPASRSRTRCPSARSCCSRPSGASASFSRTWAPPNARVVWGRAEEQATDWAGVAVAKALAQPPTAAEWCLPLVREGGAVVLWVGPSAEPRPRRPASPSGSPASSSASPTGSSSSARPARRRPVSPAAPASRRSARWPEASAKCGFCGSGAAG